MRLLALDTASAQCSAALWLAGELRSRAVVTQRDHAQLLLPMIRELLAEAGIGFAALDGIAFGRGPGSFTGLRVAASVAQGLAIGADRPVLPVSDLRALALQGHRLAVERGVVARDAPVSVAACLDARMGEVYAAAFPIPAAGLPADAPERVCPPEAFRPEVPCAVLVGPGFGAYRAALGELLERAALVLPDAEPSAAEVARLGATDLAAGGGRDAGAALPVYLRDNVARPRGP